MKFENDIFISYAHLDNQPLVRDAEGWVSQFHRALEVRVDQLLGKKSSVWRDPKLRGNDSFDDKILGHLPNVAVLVSVFTPRYVNSDSCTRELTRFCESVSAGGGLRLLDKTRIFKVLKTPVPIENHPEPVRDCLGYEFFRIDPTTGRVRELNQVFGDDAQREFWIKLDDLAQDLCQLLNWLEHGPPRPSRGNLSQGIGAVYVGECTHDVREQRDAIRRDLLGHGYRVLPDRPLPLTYDELVPVLTDSLAQCRLSVHLLGRGYGVVPEGTERSVIELQNRLAVEREQQGEFARLVWIPPDLAVEDTRQRRFIDALRSDPISHQRADLLETPFEDLKTQIHHVLAPAPAAASKPHRAVATNEARHIYLVCDSQDADSVAPVADYLYGQGFDVTLPVFDGDDDDIRADHEDNLRSTDAVLIYFGAANRLWLRAKLRECRKSAGLGRNEPLRATAVLVAPANHEHGASLRTHEARILRLDGEFFGSVLDPFLADLRAERHGPA